VIAVFVGGAGSTAGPFLGTLVIYGLSAIAQTMSNDIDVALYAQLAQLMVAILIIRFVTSRIGRRKRVAGVAH